jgi:beta-lactamase class D
VKPARFIEVTVMDNFLLMGKTGTKSRRTDVVFLNASQDYGAVVSGS